MTKRRDVLRGLAAVGVAPGVPEIADESEPRVPDVPEPETYGDAMAVVCVEAAYWRHSPADREIERASDLLQDSTLERWERVIRSAARGEEWVERRVLDEYVEIDGGQR